MCGIVGYVGSRSSIDVLLKGLKQLEYRGYDSTGVALLIGSSQRGSAGHRIEVLKSEGKLQNVQKLVADSVATTSSPAAMEPQNLHLSRCGIGHTRWATHGRPTTQNAHPHRAGHVVLVHNGIIENYLEIRQELIQGGHQPVSETDSELFAFLVLHEMEQGLRLAEAVRRSFQRIHGQCSFVVLSEKEPGTIVGARRGSPLVAALDPAGGALLASDVQPLLEYTKEVYYIEHDEMVIAHDGKLDFFEISGGQPVSKQATQVTWSADQLNKGGHSHYMIKEILEQPTALVDTLNGLLDRVAERPFELAIQPAMQLLEQAEEVKLVACGSAFHAACIGQYWIEKWAKIPASVELASEFRYRNPVLRKGTLIIAISQSGETADTLAAVRLARRLGAPTLAITNGRGSTLTREADASLFMGCGPEIAVAATKSFTSQLLILLVVSGRLATQRGVATRELFDACLRIPHDLSSSLQDQVLPAIREVAKLLAPSKSFFFMGRGTSYIVALEGALKLKEIAYRHAEGYAAGELKHGSIAMVDSEVSVIVLCPEDHWREKTLSNLEEVKARGAKILGVGAKSDQRLASLCHHFIGLQGAKESLLEEATPFLMTLAVQLLSYELAILSGTDIDQPRNLAKSVTVE